MKYYIFLAFTLLISCNKTNNIKSKETKTKKEVISIAEKKLIEVYGKSVEKQKPFVVEKKNDSIWIVRGTFPKPTIGGVAYAEVNIKTKEVIKYTHGE
jgi:hypothetical protein